MVKFWFLCWWSLVDRTCAGRWSEVDAELSQVLLISSDILFPLGLDIVHGCFLYREDLLGHTATQFTRVPKKEGVAKDSVSSILPKGEKRRVCPQRNSSREKDCSLHALPCASCIVSIELELNLFLYHLLYLLAGCSKGCRNLNLN